MNLTPPTTDHRQTIVAAIVGIAPDVVVDIAEVGDDVDLFEEFGLDSMDRLNIMTAISESTGVAIPDDRYPELTTMRALSGLLS
jgi:acyl carrier protein